MVLGVFCLITWDDMFLFVDEVMGGGEEGRMGGWFGCLGMGVGVG